MDLRARIAAVCDDGASAVDLSAFLIKEIKQKTTIRLLNFDGAFNFELVLEYRPPCRTDDPRSVRLHVVDGLAKIFRHCRDFHP